MQWVAAKDAAKPPAMHRTAPPQRLFMPQVSRWRNFALEAFVQGMTRTEVT